jgi:hypothetical protein
MSDAETARVERSDDEEPTGGAEESDLPARAELLAEENRRLREEYRRARRSEYRRTARAMAALGLIGLVTAAVFPALREVLVALAGTGGFGAVLLYYLTPERFVAAPVGERVYEARAATGAELVADLGLSDRRVYVPDDGDVRLYVPQDPDAALPDSFDGSFVVAEGARGLALTPTGAGLYREFESDLGTDPATDPPVLADQVADALTEGFELVATARPDAAEDRLSVAVADSAYGDVDRFDHPVPSFVATAVATALDRPVDVETEPVDDDRADVLVTCSWDVEDGDEP